MGENLQQTCSNIGAVAMRGLGDPSSSRRAGDLPVRSRMGSEGTVLSGEVAWDFCIWKCLSLFEIQIQNRRALLTWLIRLFF